MQITIDLEELEAHETALAKWAEDRAQAVAAVVPLISDPSSFRVYRNSDACRAAFEKARADTPPPKLIPRV